MSSRTTTFCQIFFYVFLHFLLTFISSLLPSSISIKAFCVACYCFTWFIFVSQMIFSPNIFLSTALSPSTFSFLYSFYLRTFKNSNFWCFFKAYNNFPYIILTYFVLGYSIHPFCELEFIFHSAQGFNILPTLCFSNNNNLVWGLINPFLQLIIK